MRSQVRLQARSQTQQGYSQTLRVGPAVQGRGFGPRGSLVLLSRERALRAGSVAGAVRGASRGRG